MIIAVTIQQMSFDLVEEVAFCFLILQEVMKQWLQTLHHLVAIVNTVLRGGERFKRNTTEFQVWHVIPTLRQSLVCLMNSVRQMSGHPQLWEMEFPPDTEKDGWLKDQFGCILHII